MFVLYYMFLVVGMQMSVVVYMADITVKHPFVAVVPRMPVILHMLVHMVMMPALVRVMMVFRLVMMFWFVRFSMHVVPDVQMFLFIPFIGNMAVILHMLVCDRMPVFLQVVMYLDMFMRVVMPVIERVFVIVGM